jgi:hypothetical protein
MKRLLAWLFPSYRSQLTTILTIHDQAEHHRRTRVQDH